VNFRTLPARTPTAAVGTLPGSFSVTGTGEATYSIPLVVPPGRAGMDPTLSVVYSSAAGDGVLGMGFAVSGFSAISRCPKTIVDDGGIRGVTDEPDDALCLDGKRLVAVDGGRATVEYRTFPDTFAKVIAHFAVTLGDQQPQTFDVYTRGGMHVEYGTTSDSRVYGTGDVARAWLVAKSSDRRGNFIAYSYYNDTAPDGHTLEHAPKDIRYTGFDGDPALSPTRLVRFNYDTKDAEQVRTSFVRGLMVKSTRRLSSIDTVADGVSGRSYKFKYGIGAGTRRTVLGDVRECDADDVCKPATRFAYQDHQPGFVSAKTDIPLPFGAKASPMLFDVTGDGLDDILIPDLVDANDPTTAALIPTGDNNSGVVATYWNLAASGGKVAPKVFGAAAAASMSASQVGGISLPADSAQVQPELGTALDYNQDGRMDVFVHDVYGYNNTWYVMLAQPDRTFVRFNTGIPRPVPINQQMVHLRDVNGSVHLADVDGDGVPDFIQCTNASPTAMGANDYRWELHRWTAQDQGWAPTGVAISALYGYPCNSELHTVDMDADGKTDLVVQDADKLDGQLQFHAEYATLSWATGDVWTYAKTGLPTAVQPSLMFLDANGDGLPDAIETDQSHRLITYFNTGKGFTAPVPSLPPTVVPNQDAFLGLAAPIDYDGDGKGDLLVPMPPGVLSSGSTTLPSWVILRSTGSITGPTFVVVDAQIPFEPSLSTTGIELADPRGPRVADVTGDGAADVVIALNGKYAVFKGLAAGQDLLSTIVDGLNGVDANEDLVPNVAVTYDHLTDGSITNDVPSGSNARELFTYVSRQDPARTCDYPVHCAVGPRRVVQGYELNNGADKLRHFGLKYRDGRYDRLGRGFLGFGERDLQDLDTGSVTADFYDNTTYVTTVRGYPYAGQAIRQERYSPALPGQANPYLVELSLSDVTYEIVPTNGGATYFTLPWERHWRREQGIYLSPGPGGASLAAWVNHVAATDDALVISDTYATIFAHDDYGNVIAESGATTGVDLATSVQRVIENDADRWILGQVTEQTERSSTTGDSQSRTTLRHYDGDGLLKSQTTFSDDTDPEKRAQTTLTMSLERDVYGNIVKTVAEDAYGRRRSSCVTFDEEGLFPEAYVNAAGHITYMAHDPAFSTPVASVDPNGLVTTWAYDGFGRLGVETRPGGNKTTYTRTVGSAPFAVVLETEVDGGADDVTQFDKLGRAIRWTSQPPRPLVRCAQPPCQGAYQPGVAQEIEFDDLGEHVARRSLPHPEFMPASQRKYDEYTYDGAGRVVTHTTPWSATTVYGYDGPNVITVVPPNATTVVHHDGLGRPDTIQDAATGTTYYTYGAFGTLSSVTDPGGAVTSSSRDAYGRVTVSVDPDRGTSRFTYNGFGEVVSSTDALKRTTDLYYDALGRRTARYDADGPTEWTWDDAEHGIGRLSSVKRSTAKETFVYDELSRLHGTTLEVATSSGGSTFDSQIEYDSFGRVDTVTYPQEADQPPFTVGHDYDEHGHLIAVRDALAGTSYWQLTGVDSVGRTQEETFGNGVQTTRTYHPTKSLVSTIVSTGAEEVQDLLYAYDDRLNLTLRRDMRDLRVARWEDFHYDALDRLQCMKANGAAECAVSYHYAADGNLTFKSDVGVLSYDDKAHPHAVTSFTGMPTGSYKYDDAGNQSERSGVEVKYTAFDLPTSIGSDVTLDYDGDGQRVRKTTPTGETIYAGGLFERVTPAGGGPVVRRYYVHSPERAIAVVTRVEAAGTTAYLHADNLGSTDAITDATGQVVERHSYDAFGAAGPVWKAAGTTEVTSRGFTGHEDDGDLGLVNMKGRMYDPKVGRFLTPDPIVSRPHDGQSWNPYSYVLNNPLKYVDPTGFAGETPALSDADRAAIASNQRGFVVQNGKIIGFVEKEQVITAQPSSGDQAKTTGANRPANDTGTTGGGGTRKDPERDADTSQSMAAGAGRLPTTNAGGYTFDDGESWFFRHADGLIFSALSSAALGIPGMIKTGVEATDPKNSPGVAILTALKILPVVGNVISIVQDAKQLHDYGAMMSTPDKVAAVGSIALNAFAIGSTLKALSTPGVSTPAAGVHDGASLGTSEALGAAEAHLGTGYRQVAPGVYKSADGTKVVRLTDSDLAKTGNHAGDPHMNFETGETVVKPNGKESFVSRQNDHVFLPEEK
jgi:RHS repeat-associated protein